MTTTTRFNIDTCSMLVEFNASVWTARKLDKSTTQEVIHNKNAAAKDAARVNKDLLAGRSELDDVQKLVGVIRNYVYDNTLPWSDSGIRLLPTAKFIEFNERMDQYEEEFTTTVNDFINIYPSLITAQAMALGDMFKRDEYPTAGDIASRFAFRLNYMPVPTAGDFRVDVGNEAETYLRNKMQEFSEKRVEAAMADVRSRLKDQLDRLMKQLRTEGGGKTKDGGEKMPKIYDSLIEGGIELCDMLASLNLTNDPKIEGARTALKSLLATVDIKDLRKQADARTEIRAQVEEIKSRFDF